jgi:hypothetical protein
LPGDLTQNARSLKPRLDSAKIRLTRREFDWYSYDSLANALHVQRLLDEARLSLSDVIGRTPTADIGCADGDFAFLLESLGFSVHAIDYPPSNHNGMQGVAALKQALGSAVEIHPIDIDGRFVLPADRYGAAFLMGVLYHLKNPFYALEALSKQVDYCFLSTRVAAVLPGLNLPVRDCPVAYLLDENELNADDSNFWILSEAGLRRLLHRTKWEVRAWFTAAGTTGADITDCRAFSLARSHYAMAHLELLAGWHAPEEGGFRWTERSFAVRLPLGSARMTLDFYLPDSRVIQLRAVAGGKDLGSQIFSASGRHRYARTLPQTAGDLEFHLDRFIPGDDRDHRERGIIVTALEFEAKQKL